MYEDTNTGMPPLPQFPDTHKYVPSIPHPTYPRPPEPVNLRYFPTRETHPMYYPVPPGYHWGLVPNYPSHIPGVRYYETIDPTDPGCSPVTITADTDLGPNQSDGVTGVVPGGWAGENFD